MSWEILASIIGLCVLLYGIYRILTMLVSWCGKHMEGIITFFSSIAFICLGFSALVLKGWEALGIVAIIAFFAILFALLRGRKQ